MTIQDLDNKFKEIGKLPVDLDIRGIQGLAGSIGNKKASDLSDAEWYEASKQLFLGVNQAYKEAGAIPDGIGNWLGKSALDHLVGYTGQDIQKLSEELKTKGTKGIVEIVNPIIEDTIKSATEGVHQSINPSEIPGYAREFKDLFGADMPIDIPKVKTPDDVMNLYGARTLKKNFDKKWQDIVRKYM